MACWVKRILLKSGEFVKEDELTGETSSYEGRPPMVGDEIVVRWRGKEMKVRVVWGNWPGRIAEDDDALVPIRAEEL
ncbi:hypothetical protein QFZ27_002272 [Inquilinus ginsengisoli]|uniref:hypothetical protein n=1 Tax=Inquilinus ginsengisoli TaxID=363840 RepID=UPI003D1EA1CA